MATLTTTILSEYNSKRQAKDVRGKFKNRHLTVGASEVGQCERRMGYLKKSKDADCAVVDGDHVESWGASERGVSFERLWVEAMHNRFGINLLFAGKAQRTLSSGNLSATPDAILIKQPRDLLADLMVPDIGASGCVVIDAKSIDPRIRLSAPKPAHVIQVQTQLGLVRELTLYKPDYGWLSYTNASFFDDSYDFVVKFNPAIFAVAKQRADRIINSKSVAELKPEGWILGGDECKFCAWSRACTQLRSPAPDIANGKTADPQFLSMLTDLSTAERALNTKIEELEIKQRELQNQIKDALREKRLRKIDDKSINIVWSSVAGRTSYDMVALRAAAAELGLQIEQFARAGDSTDRLTIRVFPRDRLIM